MNKKLSKIGKGLHAAKNALKYSQVSFRSIVLGDIDISPTASVSSGCFIKADKKSKIVIEDGVKILKGCRLFALDGSEIRIRKGATIKHNTTIMPRETGYGGKVEIGEKSIIHRHNSLDITGDIKIGSNVRTGENTYIHTHKHPIDEESIWESKPETGNVLVQDGCWIGTMCQLMPNTELPAKSVLAAGGVLTEKYNERGLFGGVPAKRIKWL